MDLVIDIVMLIGQIQTQVISRTGNGKTFGLTVLKLFLKEKRHANTNLTWTC